jgi:hypothetical protein
VPYRTPMLMPPRPPSARADERHDVIDLVVIRPLDEEVRAAVLWALPLGLLLAPAWVRLLDLVL